MIPNKQRVDLYQVAAILFLYSPCIDLSIVYEQIRPWLAWMLAPNVSKTLDRVIRCFSQIQNFRKKLFLLFLIKDAMSEFWPIN